MDDGQCVLTREVAVKRVRPHLTRPTPALTQQRRHGRPPPGKRRRREASAWALAVASAAQEAPAAAPAAPADAAMPLWQLPLHWGAVHAAALLLRSALLSVMGTPSCSACRNPS